MEMRIAPAAGQAQERKCIMDKFEKVEKLRERAHVSYEEAQKALEENDWDLLDAMVSLERTGKTDSPKQQKYSTSYDQQQEYISVKTKVEEQQKDKPRLGRSIGEIMQKFFRICRENWFCVKRHDDLMLRIPLFAAVIILLFTWRIAIPVMLIAMLFNFRYSVEGKHELKEVNAFMNSAGEAAQTLREGFQNAHANDRSSKSGTGQAADHAGADFTDTASGNGDNSADAAAGTADSAAENTMTPADNSAVMVPDSAASDAEGSDSNANE